MGIDNRKQIQEKWTQSKSRVQIINTYQDLLALIPLAPEAKWRKVETLDRGLEEELENNLDDATHPSPEWPCFTVSMGSGMAMMLGSLGEP